MSQKTQKKSNDESGTVRRATDLALDVAIGGTALAVDKAVDLAERAVDRAGEAIRHGEEQLERASKQARDKAKAAKHRVKEQALDVKQQARATFDEQDHRSYEDRTKDELYTLAAERDIASRSSMNKSELIDALRAER